MMETSGKLVTQDHEMVYALPASHLETLIQGLFKTHEKGIRYPLPTYLRYQPGVELSPSDRDLWKN